MLLLVSIICVAIMAGLGYLRGAIRFGVAFAALVVASLLARPLYPLTGWLVKALGAPQLLVPPLASLCTGILLFALFMIPGALWLKRRSEREPPSWDKPVGSMIGGVWGLGLVLLGLVGLNAIARVDRAMREATATVELRAEARQKLERRAARELRPLATTMTREDYEQEKQAIVEEGMNELTIDRSELRKVMAEGPLDGFLVELKHSPFLAAVEAASPVNQRIEDTMRELTVVVGDPVYLERFKKHPKVKELMQDPTVLELSRDKEIANTISQRRFRDLLDHPKLIGALEDKSLRAKFSKLDIEKLLKQVQR